MKTPMPLERAEGLARRVIEELRPFCERIEISGSIRRRVLIVNDIDLVILARERDKILERISRNCIFSTKGEQRSIAQFKSGFQLDLFFARPETHDLLDPQPSNWGALLLYSTGSQVHNVQLCESAVRKQMHFDPFRGLFRGDQLLACATEEEIYGTLGLEWVAPEKRGSLPLNPNNPVNPVQPKTKGGESNGESTEDVRP